MYRNILVPLAYAPGHHPAAEIAAAKAIAAPGARTTLLHVIGPVPEFRAEHLSTDAGGGLAEAVGHDLERVAEAFLDARVEVAAGDPADTILAHAAREVVDCIVLAPHRTDTGEYGSTAARVVRHAPCTVHLVR